MIVPKNGQEESNVTQQEIPFEIRIELLKNPYIYDVTKTGIQFTEEAKNKIYKAFKEGKSTRKILTELGIIISPLIISKTAHLKAYLTKELKRKGNFKRKVKIKEMPKLEDVNKLKEKSKDELANELAIKNQELDFLKKITNATASVK